MQWFGVARGFCAGAAGDIAAQLAEAAGHLPFGLQQQALSIAGELAGRQQFIGAELLQLLKLAANAALQVGWQGIQVAAQLLDGAGGGLVAQRVAAAQVGLNVVGNFLLETLRQVEVATHQLIGLLQRLLRPPEGGAKGRAGRNQQNRGEVGQGFEAHGVVPRL